MNITKKVIDDSLWGEKTEITPELVDFYRRNPKELDVIIDKEYFHGKFIKFFFLIGVMLTIISRGLKFVLADTWASFVNEVILDIFSELGIAVFGGAVTVFLLEKLNQKQYEQNIEFRNEIINQINESNHE